MKFLIEINADEVTPEELASAISGAVGGQLQLPSGDTLYFADAPAVTVVEEPKIPPSYEELRPGVPAGHFYAWPNEILGVVLNVRDDVVRLRSLRDLRTVNSHQIEMLATSLENGVEPAERFLRATSPAKIAGAAIELNDDTRDILGFMCFRAGPIAHLFRRTGAQIKTRAEDEQAFVIHWMLGLYTRFGSDWRDAAAEDLQEAAAKVEAMKTETAGSQL